MFTGQYTDFMMLKYSYNCLQLVNLEFKYFYTKRQIWMRKDDFTPRIYYLPLSALKLSCIGIEEKDGKRD
jgi:hypothetical protein